MAKRFKTFVKCFTLLFLLNQTVINAQILKDTVSFNLIKKGIDNIYNLRFKDAEEVCAKLNRAYPGHPVVYMLEGLITYWKNYPLLPSSSASVSFENDLRRSIELCGKENSKSDEAEYLLTNLAARGLLLLFYSDNDLSIDVIPLAASTYQYLRRSYNYTSVYTDFFFFTGIYNYTREAYPEAYPVYKPLALLFPKGDKSKGMKELQIAAKNSILFKAESTSFLSEINLGIENNYDLAYIYSKSLHELYPANIQYLAMYYKNLLLVKRYDEAEKLMTSSGINVINSYYQAQLSIFNGILQEKKYHDDKKAGLYYTKGIRDISLFGNYGNELAAYGYFGLSRISGRSGDNNYKKIYRKKAIDLADFRKVDFDN